MVQQAMYPPMPNSPQTELSAAITDTATTISVTNAAVLPAGPNMATIGSDETAETILYSAVSGNSLTGVTRGFSGTTAKTWSAGAKVARYLTSYDVEAFRLNLMDIIAQKGVVNGIGTLDSIGRQPVSQLPVNAMTATTADLTYYVRSDGNDSNNGLANTAAGAFKTIGKAISMLPKVGEHARTINVAAGTYTEEPEIAGFNGKGQVSLIGDSVTSTSRSLLSIKISNNGAPIVVKGFNLTKSTAEGVNVSGTTDFFLDALNITAAYTGNGIIVVKSKGGIQNSTISNKSYPINVGTAGEVSLANLAGTGNTYSCVAYSGKITTDGTMPNGSPLMLGGGIVLSNSGVLNPWGDNTSGSRTGAEMSRSGAATQTIAANTVTKILFSNATMNQNGLSNVTNSRFLVPSGQGGRYAVNIRAGLNPSTTSWPTHEVLSVYVNGSFRAQVCELVNPTVSGITLNGYVELNLAPGDYVEFYAFADVACTISTDDHYTYATMYRIG